MSHSAARPSGAAPGGGSGSGGGGGGLEGLFDDDSSPAGGGGAGGGASGAHMASLASRLREPVDLHSVQLRVVGGGKQAAYLPGEKAVSTANEIFGFSSWSDEIKKVEVDYCVQDEGKKWHVGIYCIMRVNFLSGGRLVSWHEDIGYGVATKVRGCRAVRRAPQRRPELPRRRHAPRRLLLLPSCARRACLWTPPWSWRARRR